VTLSGGNEVEAITQNLSGMGYVYGDGVREDILRMVPPDGHVIGSIGCGKGATEAVLVGQGREVHGVDIAPEAVALARERLTSARLIAPDDRRPFAPASLDGLILADVLEHVPRAWDALRAYAQAVRPGGWVIISVPNHRSFYAAWQYAVRGRPLRHVAHSVHDTPATYALVPVCRITRRGVGQHVGTVRLEPESLAQASESRDAGPAARVAPVPDSDRVPQG
jgi:SAM-dependent methyltransferase